MGLIIYIEIHLLKAMETGHKRPGRLCPVPIAGPSLSRHPTGASEPKIACEPVRMRKTHITFTSLS